ncbi:phage tail assembly chaperone G [Alkalibacillus salilacus]|uniref:Phage protein n=1 Tax=Alkalibacillus salilacus TaxID=284582 RepID=A0ABT9VDG1_9BACI|nr:hypothetical protein [Alkalibacillus salilacus]MDQ0158959.1 hypothetical protein [Alkalibacillus salilacus]
MQIELVIDGNKQTFSAPYVPMLAKRKFLEVQANAEEREQDPSAKDLLAEDDEIMSILTDIIFDKQFTIDQLYEGASREYVDRKLLEAIYGIKQDDEGNEEGK